MSTKNRSYLAKTLRRAAAGMLAIAVSASFIGCKKSGGTDAGAAGDKPLVVGFVYVGTKDDYGYNQAHAEGAAEVAKMDGVKIKEVEGVKENQDAQTTMEALINNQGAKLIFPTSFGYFDPHVKEIAKKYPAITFLHAGGTLKDGDPSNVGSYFAYIDEAEFLCGMAAGAATKSNKIGYVAAKPIRPVLRDINAFELGAKSVNPKVTCTVIFTGDWFKPNDEANAVNNLQGQGIDVVSGHIDSPKVLIQTADKLGMFSCGYHFNGAALSPKLYLTGAEWNWAPLYKKFVADYKAGKPMPHNFNGNLEDGTVKLSAFGPAVTPESKKAIEDVKAQMLSKDGFKMYKGPIKDNTGADKIPAGTSYGSADGAVWGIDYFVEGVIGKPN